MTSTERVQSFPSKPRVFVISDISNEPDDAESLVRFLLYANQFDVEGLVAVTSTWMKTKVCPQDMLKIIDGYADAVDNLNKHTHPSHPYPSAQYFRDLVKSGPPVYGSDGVGVDKPLTDGHQLLLERIESPSDRPLWVLVWGGTNVLAQVLLTITNKYSPEDASALRAKLRVYAISDQDDTSAWIRNKYPDIFYISSVHAWNQYGLAAWTGISGDRYYGFDQGGPDFSKVSKSWIKQHIQIGPLGSKYPDYLFIPEGDTPTFLYLIQNGLGVPENPEYGSWGGRYGLTNPVPPGQATWNKHYSDMADTVVGADGRIHRSSQASIWRWRDAYQNDFAARIQWSLNPDFAAANHHPVVVINGSSGLDPLLVDAEADTSVEFDAAQSYDPDGDHLSFKWWQYKEPTATQWMVPFEVSDLTIEPLDASAHKVKVTIPRPEKCCFDVFTTQKPIPVGQQFHLILEVADNGTPALTTYKRIIIQATNKDLRGEAGPGHGSIADVMKDFDLDG